MKNLFKNYEVISEMFNEDKKESEILTYTFNNKILDNIDNKYAVNNLLTKEEGQVFMLAYTGTGKTYTLLEAIKELEKIKNVVNDNVVYIFAVPNRSQDLQITKEYDVFGLYGGKKLKNNFKSNLIVSVYDKVKEAIDFCNKNNKEYKLIIDEAHQLNLSRYRRKAIEYLEEAIKGAKLTVYLTATPNALLYLNVNKIYNFVSKENNNMAKSFKLLEYIKNLKTAIKSYCINSNHKIMFRYNDKDATKEIVNDLTKLGYKCLIINADEKDSKFDGYNIVYTNELTNEIINFSNLPDADFYFCTSILDAGININSLNGSDDLSNLELVFVIKDSKDLLIDNIIQFSARPRKEYACFSILKKENNEIKAPISVEQNIEYYKEKVNKEIEYIKAAINLLMIKYDNDKEKVLEELRYQLNYKDLDNVTNDFNGSIVIDDDLNISINNKNLYYFCYLKSNEQLYDNNKAIIENICDKYTIETINNKKVKIDSNYKEEVNNILKESLEDKSKLKEIKGTEELKNYNLLLELEFEENEAIDIITNNNKEEFESIKNDKVIEKFNKLTDNDFSELKKVINKEISHIELRAELSILSGTETFDYISNLYKKGLDIKDILTKIDTYEDLKYLNDNYQYINTNIKYLNKEELKLKSERRQLTVIEFFEKWNLKRQILTSKKIKDLTALINDKFNEHNSEKKILEYIKKILIIDEDNNIKGLKTSYR